MAEADNIISLTITRETQTPTRDGFGTPAILAWGPTAAPMYATYDTGADGLDAMLADGWVATDPAYLAAVKVSSQNPRPSQFKVFKRAGARQVQTVRVVPRPVSQLIAGDVYQVTIGGETATYTVLGTETQDDVVNALTTAIDALTVAVDGTADTTNDWVSVASTGSPTPFFAYTSPVNVFLFDATAAGSSHSTDLSGAENLDSDWYFFLAPQDHAKAAVTAWAALLETRKALYLTTIADYDVPESFGGSVTTDTVSTLVASAYDRTDPLWHHELAAGHEGARAGKAGPSEPGSITWEFKTLAGVPVTERRHFGSAGETGFTEIKAKGGNYYRQVKGLNLTLGGSQAASGEYLDVMHGSDWLHSRIQENVLALLANADKVPYTDGGVDQVRSEILAVLRQGIRNGFLAESPPPFVTAPLVADVSATDKAARSLPDVEFEATLAGAVHYTTIAGRLVL